MHYNTLTLDFSHHKLQGVPALPQGQRRIHHSFLLCWLISPMFTLLLLAQKTPEEDSGSNCVPGVVSPQALSSSGDEGLLPISLFFLPTAPHREKVQQSQDSPNATSVCLRRELSHAAGLVPPVILTPGRVRAAPRGAYAPHI